MFPCLPVLLFGCVFVCKSVLVYSFDCLFAYFCLFVCEFYRPKLMMVYPSEASCSKKLSIPVFLKLVRWRGPTVVYSFVVVVLFLFFCFSANQSLFVCRFVFSCLLEGLFISVAVTLELNKAS